MFEDSLVESTALLRSRNRWPALVSITTQCAIAVLIVSLPLLHPELLPMPHILPATLAPPRAPVPPTTPIHLEAHPAAAPTSAVTAPVIHDTSIFRSLIHPTGLAVAAPSLPVIDLDNANASLPLGINTAATAGPRVSVAPSAARPSTPPRITSGVSAGSLIAPIRPLYPEIARITHTEGTVVIDAIISRTGALESAHVLSGPAMLQPAALEAVRQARYRPFLLNGQPTEAQTTITINFRMGG